MSSPRAPKRLVAYIAVTRSLATSASNCAMSASIPAIIGPLAVLVSTTSATSRIGTSRAMQRSNSRDSSSTIGPGG